jgi:predicted ATPase
VKIEKLEIDNFKSLNNFKIENPNPFSVFVGANGVGKSNIFEALEFLSYLSKSGHGEEMINQNDSEVYGLFGGYKNFINFNRYNQSLKFSIDINNNESLFLARPPFEVDRAVYPIGKPFVTMVGISLKNFSRLFIGASEKRKTNRFDDAKLNLDGSNMEQVLKRLLQQSNTREEIYDWLSLFVPAFSKVAVSTTELSDTDTLEFYEKGYERPFNKKLISDGTYNILSLLTAIYQSDEPQFLCIEEPENGLNPYVVKELVTFFREQCKEKGHYIWLNTHSQTLVNQLKPEEIIVVNKENGNTIAKQFIGKDMHGMAMDTAWLTNFFGGGVPW